ncbi:hypothetical protein NG895_22535 [Aeoliella sp. ICT_H6.2]|uniref:Uncharacterized protein n=1 Tax=Aeoliella straminimaris TaxID=2954799 RepID=A0A9X2FEF3_9BACT|nr:hypothetical protein [Aeoliella straminimaris]MCO6046683.1 hypothetical protein [Aeoliella straminimaris]
MRKHMLIETPLGGVLVEAESNGGISLHRGNLPHSIANGMTIDRSIACVLQVLPKSDTTDVQLSARLINSQVVGYPAPGECLECIEFETDSWHLTLGTEDLVMLYARLPDLDLASNQLETAYDASGLAINQTTVAMKVACTFHIIVSYKKLPDDRDCTAWYFADTPHEIALKAVNLFT